MPGAVRPKIAFLWENLCPAHYDRILACRDAGYDVTAIQIFAESGTYIHKGRTTPGIEVLTLVPNDIVRGWFFQTILIIYHVLKTRSKFAFFCHYHSSAIFFASIFLRIFGVKLFAMLDSKFDDYPRFYWREVGKVLLLAPYNGALAGSRRTKSYLHLLGFNRRPVHTGYDALDLRRIRSLGTSARDVPHAERDFLIVARLVAKKNLAFAIKAFAIWRSQQRHSRRLRIIGYGELEQNLRGLAAELAVADDVIFAGLADSAEVYTAMRESLCLILPSVEEQFGLVVTEALALGLPVLVSANAGSVDELVDNAVNGWIIDPCRMDALVTAMVRLDRSEQQWQSASVAALASCERGDVDHFVDSVKKLVGPVQLA